MHVLGFLHIGPPCVLLLFLGCQSIGKPDRAGLRSLCVGGALSLLRGFAQVQHTGSIEGPLQTAVESADAVMQPVGIPCRECERAVGLRTDHAFARAAGVSPACPDASQ